MNTLLLGLVLLAPADTPIKPIPETLVEMAMTLSEGHELCSSIGDIGDAIQGLAVVAPEVGPLLHDMAIAYYGDMLEDSLGWDQSLTPEAEDTYEGWLGDCLDGR